MIEQVQMFSALQKETAEKQTSTLPADLVQCFHCKCYFIKGNGDYQRHLDRFGTDTPRHLDLMERAHKGADHY